LKTQMQSVREDAAQAEGPLPGIRDREWAVIKDSFARLVSAAPHELIGPLNQAAALIALFARRQRSQDSQEAVALLGLVESAAERMQATAAGLKAWFDVTAVPCEKTTVRMNQALRMALYFLDREIKRAQATIDFEELPEVNGDAGALTNLFQILIGNAIKFGKPGVPPRIGVWGKKSEGRWVFSVADNGIGIDPEYRDRLFLPFKKLHGHSYPGAGMGLAVAKTIVDLHDGSIWIEPADGDGTTISFTLGAGV
jgi:two-component system, chemotaxis family, sensor kinase Cph1